MTFCTLNIHLFHFFLYNNKDDLYFQLFRYWKYLEDESKLATDKVSLVGIMKQDVEDIWCQVNHSTDLHASKPLISAASGIVYHAPLHTYPVVSCASSI